MKDKDEKTSVWTLPNRLSVIRILFIPIIIFFISTEDERFSFAACLLFIIAGITDGLDGFVARKMRLTTKLGLYLDPIADKLLVSSVLITLTYYKLVPLWVTVLLVGREFLINGLRSFYAMEGIAIYPSLSGKIKTTLQLVGISCILFNVPEKSTYSMCDYLEYLGISCLDFNSSMRQIGLIVIYLALFFSIFSAIDYMKALFKPLPQNNSGKKDQPR
jgi:CDP-diacylglycerol--glycerol-3-phosphate 3-phosphatidyltransferase